MLIALGPPLRQGFDAQVFFSCGKEYVASSAMVDRFVRETVEAASFRDAISDEKYDVYLLKGLPQ